MKFAVKARFAVMVAEYYRQRNIALGYRRDYLFDSFFDVVIGEFLPIAAYVVAAEYHEVGLCDVKALLDSIYRLDIAGEGDLAVGVVVHVGVDVVYIGQVQYAKLAVAAEF